jgi:hypothetical protein
MTLRISGSPPDIDTTSESAWRDALMSDSLLTVYLRHLADRRVAELYLQRSSWSAPRSGSLNIGPSARVRNSPGLMPVQRRKAR